MQLTKESIIELLAKNDKAIARALIVLKNRQNVDEQISETTKYQNNRGFRPCHARMGTSMAKFYERYGYLSSKQIAYWRRTDKNGNMRLAIYWRQLIEEAEKKAALKAA